MRAVVASERIHPPQPLNHSLTPIPTRDVSKYPKTLRVGRVEESAIWKIVQPKRVRKYPNPSRDVNQPEATLKFDFRKNNDTCSFYITNFPENWKAKDLVEIFKRYGKVVDAMIPNKRNNLGWRFAFVRFKECNNLIQLERSLDSIWIGSYKIRANISKYKRPEILRRDGESQPEKVKVHKISKPAFASENLSFAEITKKNRTPNQLSNHTAIASGENLVMVKESKQCRINSVECTGRKYDPNPEEDKWLDGAIVGKAKNFEEQEKAIIELDDLGYKNLSISILNGNQWLIFNKDGEEMKKLTRDNADWIDEWLIDWHNWESSDGIRDRICWVQLSGIPLNLWNVSFFQWCLGAEDIIIDLDINTKLKRRLDIARVKIRSSSFKLIHRNFPCVSGNLRFEILIKEEAPNPREWYVPLSEDWNSNQQCNHSEESSEDVDLSGEEYAETVVSDSTFYPSDDEKSAGFRFGELSGGRVEKNLEIGEACTSEHNKSSTHSFRSEGPKSVINECSPPTLQETELVITSEVALEENGGTQLVSNDAENLINQIALNGLGLEIGQNLTQENYGSPIRPNNVGPDERTQILSSEILSNIGYTAGGIRIFPQIESSNPAKNPEKSPITSAQEVSVPKFRMVFESLSRPSNPRGRPNPVEPDRHSSDSSLDNESVNEVAVSGFGGVSNGMLPTSEENKKMLFKKARRKRLNKIRKKKEAKKKVEEWASFIAGVSNSPGKVEGKNKENKLKGKITRGTATGIENNHNSEALCGKALNPFETLEMGKDLELFNEADERAILQKIQVIEQRNQARKEGVCKNVDQ